MTTNTTRREAVLRNADTLRGMDLAGLCLELEAVRDGVRRGGLTPVSLDRRTARRAEGTEVPTHRRGLAADTEED